MPIYDFHSHILPGVDDGARDLDVTLGMIKQLSEQGADYVLATSHQIPGESFGPSADEIRRLCSEINSHPDVSASRVTVIPGSEIAITPDTCDDLASGRVLTLGDRNTACLIELPVNDYPNFADDIIFSIQVSGITPVLAHPERNRVLAQDHTKIFDLVNRGILLQVNAGSLLGLYGKEIQNTAELLLRSRWAHFIGSDAHSLRRRPVLIGSAKAHIEKVYGVEYAQQLLEVNPEMLLSGQEIRQEPLSPRQGRGSVLSRVLSRFAR